jgi:hypothetical protein
MVNKLFYITTEARDRRETVRKIGYRLKISKKGINMETQEILKLLPNLSVSDRLIIAEAALELIHQERTSLSLI